MSRPTAKDLAVAARDGLLDEMARLLAIGVAINDVVEFGGTALTQAAAADQRAAVQFLLEKGADINVVTAGNVSVVGIAAEKGFEAVTRLLCESGADLKIPDRVRSRMLTTAR